MRFRKLRIAWSVGCGMACVLLIVLWVRSFCYCDHVMIPTSHTHSISGWSARGQVFCVYFPSASEFLWTSVAADRNVEHDRGSVVSFLGDWCFNVFSNYGSTGLTMPYWFPVLMTAALVVLPWAKRISWRFSLRTLLIATTLVAVVLGLIAATR
jgi:hypothetical protein